MGTAAFAVWSVAVRLVEVAYRLTGVVTRFLFPIVVDSAQHDHVDRLQLMLLEGTRLSLAMVVPMSATLAILAGPALHVWVGPRFAGAVPLVWLLSIVVATRIGTDTLELDPEGRRAPPTARVVEPDNCRLQPAAKPVVRALVGARRRCPGHGHAGRHRLRHHPVSGGLPQGRGVGDNGAAACGVAERLADDHCWRVARVRAPWRRRVARVDRRRRRRRGSRVSHPVHCGGARPRGSPVVLTRDAECVSPHAPGSYVSVRSRADETRDVCLARLTDPEMREVARRIERRGITPHAARALVHAVDERSESRAAILDIKSSLVDALPLERWLLINAAVDALSAVPRLRVPRGVADLLCEHFRFLAGFDDATRFDARRSAFVDMAKKATLRGFPPVNSTGNAPACRGRSSFESAPRRAGASRGSWSAACAVFARCSSAT